MEPAKEIPVWVKLVDLKPCFWNDTAIGKIVSKIGKPIGVDYDSLQKHSLDWPRVQLIINSTKQQKNSVQIHTHKGEVINQKIEFEYLPRLCNVCKVFGHYSEGCNGPEARRKQPNQPKPQSRPHQSQQP